MMLSFNWFSVHVAATMVREHISPCDCATVVAACSLDFVLSRSSTISHVGVATAMGKVATAVVVKVPAAAAALLA